MNTQNTQAIAAIAQGMRSSVSRRRLLQAAGIGSAAMVATACGTGSSDSTEASAAEDMSDSEMVVNWSNWPLYLDEDEDTGGNPSLEEFQSSTGIGV